MTSLKAASFAVPLFLAESTMHGVRSSALGEFLVNAAALAVIIMVIWNLVDRMRGGATQKREIKFADELATQVDLKQAHGRIARERTEINKELETIKKEAKTMRENLDREIDDLQDRVDKVPERTIRLLRETKGLI